jgi:hypothetical protein
MMENSSLAEDYDIFYQRHCSMQKMNTFFLYINIFFVVLLSVSGSYGFAIFIAVMFAISLKLQHGSEKAAFRVKYLYKDIKEFNEELRKCDTDKEAAELLNKRIAELESRAG